MSLTNFMRDLVADPKRLEQYKRDPDRFLAREGKDLQQADRELLRTLSNIPVTLEVSTVMSVRKPPSSLDIGLPGTIPDGAIWLEGIKVTLVSPRTIFLAEQTAGDVRCHLLPHSYLHIDKDVKTFSLHICYVSPKDPNDVPFVLQIGTDDVLTEPDFDLNGVEVLFIPTKYVLVLADVPAKAVLDQGSYYDPSAKTLVLNIIPPNTL